MMRRFAIPTALLLLLAVTKSHSQTYCRGDDGDIPHQQTLWIEEFPVDVQPYALCEGSVTVESDGTICIDGRVTYKQLREAVGKPIREPSINTISISGHLVTGSGNVILGPEGRYLYDFVKRYTIGGVTYEADKTMADKLLAASRGTIDSVCLDASFAQDESRYSISHNFWFPGSIDFDKATDANILYMSAFSAIAEYHETSNYSPFFGEITNSLITFASMLPPSFAFRYIPLLAFTGIFRLFVVGTVSTDKFPQPLTSPNVRVEDVQIDTEWDTLMAAMEAGLFTEDKLPLYFGAFIKKIEPQENSNACWNVTAAAIDIQAPNNQGDKLDEFVANTVLPALTAVGNFGLHLGKRLDSGSEALRTALATYERQCNVQLNVQPENCYHPVCTRSDQITSFQYPDAYYA